MSTIILQRFANREYRLTHQDIVHKPRKKGDKYVEVQAEKYATAVHDTYVLQQELQQGEVASISDGRLERHPFGEVDARQALRALDIINEFQTKEKNSIRGGWGKLAKPTKFTKNARHRLLEAGAVVDATCGLNAWEVTLTIPGSGHKIFNAVAAWSGWLMNELTQLLRRAKCLHWFYVWELQKRGALHLHLLIADTAKSLLGLARKIESRWWVLLQSLSQKLSLDLFAKSKSVTWRHRPQKWQSHVSPIRKSVAAYFSKYAGKGSNSGQNLQSSQTVGMPARWWGSSRQIKKDITATRQKWQFQISPSCSREVKLCLEEFLKSHPRIKTYEYDFDLGVTPNGTNLGGGNVCINYYADIDFKRMQTWEEYYMLQVGDILCRHGYADMDMQTWTDADIACKHPLDVGMSAYRESLSCNTRTPSPSPLNQPTPYKCKLSKSRGTQPQATLELRAHLVKFLAGGDGETTVRKGLPVTFTYTQGELFNKDLYTTY